MLLRPLCPPAEPAPRSRNRPTGRATSSTRTRRSLAGIELRKRAERRERRAAPVHVGLRLEHARPGVPCQVPSRLPGPLAARETVPAASARPGGRPDRNPALCRVSSYSGPGLPSPTMACRAQAFGSASSSASALGFRMSSGSVGAATSSTGGRRLFGPRRHDGADRRVGIVQDLGLLDLTSRTNSEWPMASAVTSRSSARDVGRQHLDLELAEHVVEHAAEVPHAVGDADQVDRHCEGDLLVGPDLVEVEVDDLGRAERVPLDLADQRLDRRRGRPRRRRTIVVPALIPISILLSAALSIATDSPRGRGRR